MTLPAPTLVVTAPPRTDIGSAVELTAECCATAGQARGGGVFGGVIDTCTRLIAQLDDTNLQCEHALEQLSALNMAWLTAADV